MMRSAARSASVTGDPSVLPSTFMARTVDGEDGGAGPDHQIGQRLDQRGGGLAIDHGRTCLIHERGSFAVRLPLPCAAPCWQHAAAQCIKPAEHA